MTAIVLIGVPVAVVGYLQFFLLPFCLLALLSLHPKWTRTAAWIGGGLATLIVGRIVYFYCLECCTYFWCDWV